MTFRFQVPIYQLYLPTQIRGYPPPGVTSILKGLDQIIPGQSPGINRRRPVRYDPQLPAFFALDLGPGLVKSQ